MLVGINLNMGRKGKINLDDNFKKLSKDKKFKKQIFWENNGIILKNKYNESDRLRLIIPDLNDDQCFLVTKNFDVILNWNRSNYFALTVFFYYPMKLINKFIRLKKKTDFPYYVFCDFRMF